MPKGKLIFQYGTMNSGKSLQLLATANNFAEKGIAYLPIKSGIDNREGPGVIHSRALGDLECVPIHPEEDIFKMVSSLMSTMDALTMGNLKWILVDESQFLTEEQIDQLAAIADNLGVNIICYGLRTDFQGHLFPGSKRLFELADSIGEIKSSCSCGSKSIMNLRTDSMGNAVMDGEQVMIGGDDVYVSMCRKCFFEKTGGKYYKNNKGDNML